MQYEDTEKRTTSEPNTSGPDSDSELEVFDPEAEFDDSVIISEYDLISTPNDFNILTIKSFLDGGSVRVPRYQRNYVWDRPRASKLIESLLLGLPIPQVFLYEEARNSFQIIDGQQRLLSIYFFMVGRFPRKAARPHLREFWGTKGAIPAEILHNDVFFEDFKLALPTPENSPKNPLHGEKYETLGDRQTQLDMKTLRNIVIKQINPEGRGAVYEIFNRLNTTGVNLTAQEIRVSLADSALMEMVIELNSLPAWRELLGNPNPDPRLKDIEIILRAFAMSDVGAEYKPSMVRFLNAYADQTRKMEAPEVAKRKDIFTRFALTATNLDRSHFLISNRFSVPIFEAVFTAFASSANPNLSNSSLSKLKSDSGFSEATSDKTTDTRNVLRRIELAKKYLTGRA